MFFLKVTRILRSKKLKEGEVESSCKDSCRKGAQNVPHSHKSRRKKPQNFLIPTNMGGKDLKMFLIPTNMGGKTLRMFLIPTNPKGKTLQYSLFLQIQEKRDLKMFLIPTNLGGKEERTSKCFSFPQLQPSGTPHLSWCQHPGPSQAIPSPSLLNNSHFGYFWLSCRALSWKNPHLFNGII